MINTHYMQHGNRCKSSMKYYEYVDTPPEHQREQKKQCLYQCGLVCIVFVYASASTRKFPASVTPCRARMIKQAPQDHAKSKSPRPWGHVVEWTEMDQTVLLVYSVQWFMNLWYDSLDSLTILKSNIMLRDCEWEDCDSRDRNKSLSKQNQSNTLLEVGHGGGQGIPLDLDGREPCPKTYGITLNKRFWRSLLYRRMVIGRHRLFHQFHQSWQILTRSAKANRPKMLDKKNLFTPCRGPFRDRYVLQVKGHGKKTATSGAFSGQHQPPREMSSKHTKTHKSPVKGKEHVAPQKAEVWWRMRSWRDMAVVYSQLWFSYTRQPKNP